LFVVAVITASAIPAAARNLARTSAAQLWSAFYVSVIANNGHKTLKRAFRLSRAAGLSCIRKSCSAPGMPYFIRAMGHGRLMVTESLCGAGEGNVHSSVVHSHGFVPAADPLNILQNRLQERWPVRQIVAMAASVMNRCKGAMAATYCTPVSSE